MNIRDIRTCDLKPYENNPRINEDAVDLVAASIDEFGFKQPIVVDKDLIIIAGHTRWEAAQKLGLNIRQTLIWNKNTFALGRQDYQWKHEPRLYGWKDGAAHYFVNTRNLVTVLEDTENLDIDSMKKDELKNLLKSILGGCKDTTILDEKKPTKSDLHPTMKPIPLIARQIKSSSRTGENVLDLFGGSGSTLMACEQLGRRCFMMEYDPHYADVIIKRWEDYTGEQAELIEDAC